MAHRETKASAASPTAGTFQRGPPSMPPPASRLASPSSPSSLSRPTPTTATASERRVKAPSRPREWPRGTFLFALWPRRRDLPTPNTVIISDLRDMDVHQHLSCTASDVPSGLTRDTRAKSKNVTALAPLRGPAQGPPPRLATNPLLTAPSTP